MYSRNLIAALLPLSLLFFSLHSPAEPQLLSKEIVFWSQNQETFHLPVQGNFVVVLDVLNGEDLNINGFKELVTELAQLNPKPKTESLHIRAHERGDFAFHVEECSKACVEKLLAAAESLKIRSILTADYSPEDLIGSKNYFFGLVNAVLDNKGDEVDHLLRDSAYARFLNLPAQDVSALKLVFATEQGRKIVDDGYLRDLILFISHADMTLDTMKIGAYSHLGRSETISDIAQVADLGEQVQTPSPKSGDILLRGDEDRDDHGTRTQYYQIPQQLTALEYLVFKNDVALYPGLDGEQYKIISNPDAISSGKDFILVPQ